MKPFLAILACCLGLLAHVARADITIGVVLSLTGPGASLGIPEKNTVDMMPKTFAGQPVRYIVLDDATDSTAAVRAARKLIEDEKADLILGPSVTPTSLALVDVVARAETPMIVMAGCDGCILPPTGPRALGVQAGAQRQADAGHGGRRPEAAWRQDHRQHRLRHRLRRHFCHADGRLGQVGRARSGADGQVQSQRHQRHPAGAARDGRQPRRGVHRGVRHPWRAAGDRVAQPRLYGAHLRQPGHGAGRRAAGRRQGDGGLHLPG